MEIKYQYKSLARLTKVAVIMAVMLNATQIVGNITNQIDFRTYTPLDFSHEEFAFSPNYTIDIIFHILVSLNIFVIPGSVIFFLWWISRAIKNIHLFGAKNVYSSKMAMIWFFVPFLNLSKGYQTVKQIWKASHPDLSLINGNEWKDHSMSLKIVRVWWISMIVIFLAFLIVLIFVIENNLLSRLTLVTIELGISWSDILLTYTISTLISALLLIIPTIFYIKIINQVSKWQDTKAKDIKIDLLGKE